MSQQRIEQLERELEMTRMVLQDLLEERGQPRQIFLHADRDYTLVIQAMNEDEANEAAREWMLRYDTWGRPFTDELKVLARNSHGYILGTGRIQEFMANRDAYLARR